MGFTKKILKHEIAGFNPRSYVQYYRSGIRISKPPVFIVGCSHSGTTLMRHLLGIHPNIYAVPYESHIFCRSAIKIHVADIIWSFTAVSHGKTCWVEKTPAHINHMDRIFKYYPESKVLLLIRDGRDVSISLCKRWGDFERSVRCWVQNNKAGEPYWTHPQVMKLYYEQLVSDFENQIKVACDFIGETCDSMLLSFAQANPVVNSQDEIMGQNRAQPREFRDKQIMRGLYDASGRWTSQMSEKEKEIFKKMAGNMLIKYGYAEDMNW